MEVDIAVTQDMILDFTFTGDFTEEELRLMRVKFISEVGN